MISDDWKKKRAEWQRRMQEHIQSGRSDFNGEIIEVAMEIYNAGVSGCGDDFDLYSDELWKEYQDAGKPTPLRNWVIHRLQNEFVSVDVPPRWVGSEPNWAFHEGRPMVFIHQTPELPKNDITSSKLNYAVVLFIFGIRVVDPQGHQRVIYKLIEESTDIRGANGVQSNAVWIGGEPGPCDD